jgi:predicted Zn finger-like uncharacterized protein
MDFIPDLNPPMPRRGKLDLDQIRASLDVTCPHCKTQISPEHQQRLNWDHLKCLNCGQLFVPMNTGLTLKPSK